MKFFVLLFLISQGHAALDVQGEDILPFTNKKYPLKDLIKDYADMMDLTVTYPSEMIKEQERTHLEMNSKTSKEEFKRIFHGLLAGAGYAAIEEDSILWIYYARDIRYLTTKLYKDESYPKDASFSTVMYKLENPISSEVARNLRPFMSRYGRVIDFPDGRTIIINDHGDNIERLILTMKSMDQKSSGGSK